MFSVGFGFFLFFTITVALVSSSVYYTNKTDKAAQIRIREIELEEKRIKLEEKKCELEIKQLEKQL
jgi:hypothetical protein